MAEDAAAKMKKAGERGIQDLMWALFPETGRDPLLMLRGIKAAQDELENERTQFVDAARLNKKASWTEIGEALGITKQAAAKRYGSRY